MLIKHETQTHSPYSPPLLDAPLASRMCLPPLGLLLMEEADPWSISPTLVWPPTEARAGEALEENDRRAGGRSTPASPPMARLRCPISSMKEAGGATASSGIEDTDP